MEARIRELETVLEEEFVVHDQLLGAAIAMNGALKREAVEEVQKANTTYDECGFRIEQLEEKRLSISGEIGRLLNLPAHGGLLRIIEALPVDHGTRLSEVRAKLHGVIAKLHKANVSNRILLTESLLTIAKTFEFISTASEKFTGYKRRGKKDPSKISRTIINAIA